MLSVAIDTSFYLDGYDDRLIYNLYEILKRINSLFYLENLANRPVNIEHYLFSDVVKILGRCSEFIDRNFVDSFDDQIDSIKGGLFDLKPIEFHVYNKINLILLFGKVYTPDRRKSYSGVLGLRNINSDALVKRYKSEVISKTGELGLINKSILNKLQGLENNFNCMDVVKYSGFINRMHLPISLFFSGKDCRSMSALPNTYLFTNIYFQRYFLISDRLGRKFIEEYDKEIEIEQSVIQKILTLWLWGHDMGHSVLEDNFVQVLGADDKYLHEVFHEIWSDVFSLYLLKELSNDFLEIDKRHVLIVFLSEMLRYIRRGDFQNYPDSVSAMLIYRLFVINGIIRIYGVNGTISIDFVYLNKFIDDLLVELEAIFYGGSIPLLYDFIKKAGLDFNFSNANDLTGIDIKSFEIPTYISILNY